MLQKDNAPIIRRPGRKAKRMSDLATSNHTLCRRGDISVAYQTMGHGSIDRLWSSELFPTSNSCTRLFRAGRIYCAAWQRSRVSYRSINADRASLIACPAWAMLEERMDDVSAIMEAIGSKRAVLVGIPKVHR